MELNKPRKRKEIPVLKGNGMTLTLTEETFRDFQKNNRPIGKCVCIDWDLWFDDFLKIAKYHSLTLIKAVEERTGRTVKAFYQESASGNVHISLRFEQSVSVLDAFLIRAWMGDDETRLRLDLARYFKTSSLHEMNRCFQDKIKIKNGQATLKSAGPWIPFEEIELPDITTIEAHTLISNLQDERRKAKRNLGKPLTEDGTIT